MASIIVNHPGMYTTVQDLGRRDFQQYGMPVSGSMDHFAHRVANLLVGNAKDAPVLEMTILGGTYTFDAETIIAITGANMSPVLNNTEAVGMWRTIRVQAGDVLKFQAAAQGCRTYIAIAGSLSIPKVLGSFSTYVRGKMGGYLGRPIKKDDILKCGENNGNFDKLDGRFVEAQYIPKYDKNMNVRVILGPQDDAFTRKGIADFFSAPYKVSSEFDRMGYRLEGTAVEHVDSADIISDGIVRGAIQIPGHGQPIIMLADCQTTGGYTKIAHVITSDLWKIAQAKAGDEVKFIATDIEEAHKAYRDVEETMEKIEAGFSQSRIEKDRNFKLSFMNKVFSVKVNEIKSY